MLQQTQVATVIDYYNKWMKVETMVFVVLLIHSFCIHYCLCVPALAHGSGSLSCYAGGNSVGAVKMKVDLK